MKTIHIKIMLSIFVVSSIIANFSCGNIKDDITEGLAFEVNTNLLLSPLTIQFIDADLSSGKGIDAPITIEIKGTTTEIYTNAGSKNLTPIDGILNLAVKRSVAISPENPLEFTIYANANGYLTGIKSFKLVDTLSQFVSVSMVKKDGLPAGASAITQTIQAPVSGTPQDITLETPLTNGKTEQGILVIPAGTTFFDKDNNQLSGSMSVYFAHFDNQSTSALNSYPAGNTGKGKKGNTDQNGAFLQSGFINLTMTIGGVNVSTLVGDVKMTVQLNNNSFNPDANQPIAAGQTINIYSFDTNIHQWKEEMVVDIFSNGSKLACEYNQTHLSWWSVGYFAKGCSEVKPFAVVAPQLGDKTAVLLVEYIDAVSGYLLKDEYLSIRNGASVYLYNLPDRLVKMRLRDGDLYCRGEVLLETGDFETCTAMPTLDFSGLNITNARFKLDITATCEGEPSLTIRPSFYAYYKRSDCAYWSWLGTMVNGSLETTRLKPVSAYDFKVVFADKSLDVEGIISPEVTNQDIPILLPNFIIPKEYCNLIF